jgi:glycosyltransferase involved in cell wall biosynthesis
MKNILIFSYIPPAFLAGGPVQSIYNLVSNLDDSFHFFIITPTHDLNGEFVDYEKFYSRNNIKFQIIKRDIINPLSLINLCKENSIDYIYLNSFFNARALIPVILSKLFYKSKIILAPRGEFEPIALRNKKVKKWIYTRLVSILVKNIIYKFHATNFVESQNIYKILKISNKRIVVIPNLKNFELNDRFYNKSNKRENLLNLVFYSRIVPIKNLDGLLSLLLNCIDIKVNLDIYGHIEDPFYWKKCLKIITRLNSLDNFKVSYKGIPNQQNLLEVLNDYDCFIFPTHSENFGHVILEAMTAGLPVIVNNTTPFTVDILKYKIGSVVDFSDDYSFREILRTYNGFSQDEYLALKSLIKNYLVVYNKKNSKYIEDYRCLFTS